MQFDILEKFNWQETHMVNEIPEDDVWDNFATKNKLRIQRKFKELNMPKECSKHYMALNPDLNDTLKVFLKPFEDKLHRYNFLKLTPGHNLWMHYDTYSTFVHYNNISEEQAEKIKRTIIMLSPWERGQILQVEDNDYTKWNVGDEFTWSAYAWHGVGNFSFSDFVIMQITWLDGDEE